MPPLHVALQEGFHGEKVVVLLDGKEVQRYESLQTRMQISKAASFEISAQTGAHNLQIQLHDPSTGTLKNSKDFSINLTDRTLYYGISIMQDGEIRSRSSDAPFGYA